VPVLGEPAKSGRLVASHAFPGEAPLRCAIGDADGSSLYVTSEDGWLYRAEGFALA